MDLKQYFSTGRKQADLARLLSVTPGTVNQWVTGTRPTPADRCIEIERVTDGVVRCEDLRPDVDWAYLRGTNPDQKQPTALDGHAVGAIAEGVANA